MSRVYKAVQRPLDRVVALKVLGRNPEGDVDPGFEKRFFLEASMTARLKHPNTITVHDYGRTDDGVFFLAMEYLEGETLARALKAGPFPWPRALSVGAQVARSLREAHRLGLVHRDLKPANIMLLTEGTGGDVVKVLDFGLVKSFAQPGAPPPPNLQLTQAGVLLGSPLYMAPEQARNEADPRTDVYALGVVLYQAIAGRTPFVGTQSVEVIVKHMRERPPPLRELVPAVPEAVHALVMRCLAKKPAERFQSMDELLDAMRAASSGQGAAAIFADPRARAGDAPRPEPVPSRPAPRAAPDELVTESAALDPRRPRRAKMLVGLIAAALALAAAGWLLTHMAPAAPTPDAPGASTP
jgi:serine/threonine-protein kinase